MPESNEELGTIALRDGIREARLERHVRHDADTVWSMLTESARLAEWLAPGAIDPVPGGAVKLEFADSGTVIDSTVSAVDAPRLLEYSWSGPGEPERPVRWEINPTGIEAPDARLVLTVRIPADEDIARTCAGWEAHLMMLLAALDGSPIAFPFERFQSTRAAYTALAGS